MPSSSSFLVRYASMGTQWIILLGLFTYIGHWIDKKTHSYIPIFIWLLPILCLFVLLLQIVRHTQSKKKHEKRKKI